MDHDATLPLQSGSSLCSTGQQHGIAPTGRGQPVPERKRGRGAEGSRTPSTSTGAEAGQTGYGHQELAGLAEASEKKNK